MIHYHWWWPIDSIQFPNKMISVKINVPILYFLTFPYVNIFLLLHCHCSICIDYEYLTCLANLKWYQWSQSSHFKVTKNILHTYKVGYRHLFHTIWSGIEWVFYIIFIFQSSSLFKDSKRIWFDLIHYSFLLFGIVGMVWHNWSSTNKNQMKDKANNNGT